MVLTQHNNLLVKIVIGLTCLIFGGVTFVPMYQTLTTGSADLFPCWNGIKLYLEDGISPYSEYAGEASQMQIYGRLADSDEDKMLCYYPFYMVFFLAPTTGINYQVAAAIFQQMLMWFLLVALGLMLSALDWLPSPVMLAVLILSTLLSYFSIRGLLLAQMAIWAYLGQIIALWGVYKQRDWVAGIGLAIATIKPQTGYLAVPFLLLWAWQFKRTSIIKSFLVIFGTMMAVSLLIYPDWFTDWLTQLGAYEGTTHTLPMTQVMSEAFLSSDGAKLAQLALSILLAIPVGWAWWQLLVKREQVYFLWTYCLTVVLSLSIAPPTATTSYIHLYPVLYLVAWQCRYSRMGQGAFYLFSVLWVVGYWALHIATVPPADEGAGIEAPIVYVVFPVLVWGILYLVWHQQPIITWPQPITSKKG